MTSFTLKVARVPLMASHCFLFTLINLFALSFASPNPQTFIFDPSSPPGPLQECSEGIPKMGGPIPFPAATQLNDDNIGYWVERHTECLWGNYFNNAQHIDYATLVGEHLAEDYEICYKRFDESSEKCYGGVNARKRAEMFRDVLDAHEVISKVTEVNERSITISSNGLMALQVQIGSFQIGHKFEHDVIATYVFNDDGALRKHISWTEDDLSFDMSEWAEKTLKGMGDYLKVDHANKDQYYQIDLGDTAVRVFIAFIIFWVICAPIGMVWIAMRYCNNQKVNKYANVNVDSEAET